jgi:anti-sigma regulatory factor (Ser/Thr protein kinase)
VSLLTLPPGALHVGEAVQSEHQLELDPVPRLVAAAREFVRQHTPLLDEEAHETVVLLTSELVTNVVIHARTVLRVGVSVTESAVIVTVRDLDVGNSELPGHREGGRGWVLIDALADASGMHRQSGDGKTAWFRVRRATGTEPDRD